MPNPLELGTLKRRERRAPVKLNPLRPYYATINH
jgi:hypothetical protein